MHVEPPFQMPADRPAHSGSLAPISIWGPLGLKVGGYPISLQDQSNWDDIEAAHPRGSTVNLTVENEDPQLAADIALLAKHTLLKGEGLWGKENSLKLPPERIHQAAEGIRRQLPPAGTQVAAGWQKGSPYPKNDDEVDHSAPGHDIPDKVNEIYNAVKRENPGYSKSKAMAIAWSRSGLKHEGSKEWVSAGVSSDMKHESQFQVVALGELQQPGGVGAVEGYNPAVDGPNPDGMSPDNAGNSPEQEQALETWVNMAVDMINRGESPEQIVAQLAHDGCPNAEEIYQRAAEQPAPDPDAAQVGQDPFKAPTPPDPTQQGEMQGLSQQPPVTASAEDDQDFACKECGKKNGDWDDKTDQLLCAECKDKKKSGRVRIAGTTLTGTVEETWESVWGERNVKVALDDGGSMTVAPEALQSVADGTDKDHPVTEIQQFMDSLPEVKPTRPYIEARLANLEVARRAVRGTISKVGFSDQVKLQEIDLRCASETGLLKEVLASHVEDFEVAYARAQTKFAYNAYDVADAEKTPYQGRAKEAGAVWASENFDGPVDNTESFTAAAATYASNLGLDGSQFKAFLAGAEEHRHVTTDEFDAAEPETADNEGPAEALFI